jgi:holo-[acyl-carrier protein] synthase
MILGLGNDLCDIRRIEASLARFGERFTRRVFTEIERATCEGRAQRAASYARRFAAKEACAKALGSGVPKNGVHWLDLGVVNLPTGRPGFELAGGAARWLQAITPSGMVARIDLSITDDYPLAQAVVLISAVPSQAQ